jgi:hypothetical protein
MKSIIRTILFFSFIALSTTAAYACECEIMKASKKLRQAKAVFVGEAVAIENNKKSERATFFIKFKVERYWKGAKKKFITVAGMPGTVGPCGLAVVIGEKYLIYAFGSEENHLEASFCESWRLDRAADDLALLGKGKTLKPNE